MKIQRKTTTSCPIDQYLFFFYDVCHSCFEAKKDPQKHYNFVSNWPRFFFYVVSHGCFETKDQRKTTTSCPIDQDLFFFYVVYHGCLEANKDPKKTYNFVSNCPRFVLFLCRLSRLFWAKERPKENYNFSKWSRLVVFSVLFLMVVLSRTRTQRKTTTSCQFDQDLLFFLVVSQSRTKPITTSCQIDQGCLN